MSQITLHHGDNRETLRRLIKQGVRVHSVVTDPPYGLTSITKRFGGKKAAPAKFGSDGAFSRASAGFMGSKWDGTGIERDPEFWALIWDILLPGGYVAAFSGSRTGHWQACAMEMAGFVMHPFLGWVYGSGFPKAHNAAMAIDKQLGAEGGRGEPKTAAHAGWIERGAMRGDEGNAGWQRDWMQDAAKVDANARKYLPGSPEAAQWEGWAYGGQALKPALEPIYIGQKPFSEKNGALNLLKHGVGAINIDGCRVALNGDYKAKPNGRPSQTGLPDGYDPENANQPDDKGRHPANLLHDGSGDVVALFPQSKGQQGDVRGTEKSHTGVANTHCYGEFGRVAAPRRGDGDGSAARFFNSFDADPIRYQSKATKADRAGSKHPTVKPVCLMEWLVTLLTPPGGTVLDPFAGSGTTGQAAHNLGFDCILMEAEDQFAADIRRRFDLAAPVTVSEFDDLLGDSGVPVFEDLLG